ncbi:hypothetical protein Y032_0028g1778 [Ancylostoma ceylanicum]|uniref:Uncharacterized protein n=1 Tax=Ancylostoma ceylanicum TaxID=53326 RepID=A0A016US80_9BILA|nr:hypothetical protein Y032_0028g1778 [Ancylostoma ceylanicum]
MPAARDSCNEYKFAQNLSAEVLDGIERRRKMHHRKQRNGTTTATTTTPLSKSPKSDSGSETKARLRFHKKPLCLQYMVSSQCAKRHNFYKSKPKEPSLIIALVVGMIRLFSWIEYFIRNDLWYFITTPVEELERRLQETPNISRPRLKKRMCMRDKPASYVRGRRDLWNQSKMLEWNERRSFSRPQICYA